MFAPNPEIIHARGAMAWTTQGYWQDAGCCLRTFMLEKLFGLRQGIHLHVFDAVLRSIHTVGLGSAAQSSHKQA